MRVVHSAFCLGMSCLASASAMAQADAPAQAQASASCVDVSVNNHPALSYACLNQRVAVSAHPAPQPPIALDAVTQLPSNQQVGQFNYAAFSHQMGPNLDKSVKPWRPPPLQPLPMPGVPVGTH